MFDWGHTCLKHIDHLGGASVDETSLRKLMYLAWRFSPVVDAYKNIKAYHAGDGMWVECDLLLDPKTNLKEAHDVSELVSDLLSVDSGHWNLAYTTTQQMQYCFEGLNEVDRAFVSVVSPSSKKHVVTELTLPHRTTPSKARLVMPPPRQHEQSFETVTIKQPQIVHAIYGTRSSTHRIESSVCASSKSEQSMLARL
jgi:hypothetical protein